MSSPSYLVFILDTEFQIWMLGSPVTCTTYTGEGTSGSAQLRPGPPNPPTNVLRQTAYSLAISSAAGAVVQGDFGASQNALIKGSQVHTFPTL